MKMRCSKIRRPSSTDPNQLRRVTSRAPCGMSAFGKERTTVDWVAGTPNARHLMPFSSNFGPAEPDMIQRQEGQIVQSCLNLRDLLP